MTHVVGDVKNKTCIVYDDMIDTGGSVIHAKEALIKGGANKDVYLCATHAIFSNGASDRLKKAKFKEVVVTNSVPVEKKRLFPGLHQISLAPLLADVIENVAHQESVSKLFF